MQQLPTQPSAGFGSSVQLDDATLDTFLAEIDRHIDTRLAQMQAIQSPPAHKRDAGNITAIVGVGIPFVVLAGVFGHTPGAIVATIVIGVLGVAQMIREHLA
ncbi:MAG TPA: hypothetical protein VKV26_13300 [Dehalococcoidia bacterium]|nr:hypothetical protein [Dehalococcoidia bacterium]